MFIFERRVIVYKSIPVPIPVPLSSSELYRVVGRPNAGVNAVSMPVPSVARRMSSPRINPISERFEFGFSGSTEIICIIVIVSRLFFGAFS